MAIQTGDKLPNTELKIMGAKGPEAMTIEQLTAGKKVVLFAVPGAFTPGCSNTHVPGYVVNADVIKAKGVDSIICLSVNDAFVMGAWGKDQNAEALTMLADGNGSFTREIGLTMDASGFQMGERSQRYAMIVDDGVVSYLAVEPAGGVDVSAAEKIIAQL
ncbi:Peroxiredoxin [Sinobacterium norvegicum]|uniref:Glutathione-dependent peroxiredoxin n=1 Tax=Sinobacterium norvegicum TaxID=1641715 RepID=A0ABM9ACX3_9GAMM|nr:peroxiredoxin [Sinobacterium norvegicum]CAH0991044.1 Peroxiredoxin [Sinobacterium norvegicum]